MKHSVPYLAANGGGSIVAMSSIAATATHRYMTPYNVSKAGLEMLVRQVADELGSMGIRANAVRPSLVPTDISAGLTGVPDIVEDYLEQMPLHRLGTTDDIAAAVAGMNSFNRLIEPAEIAELIRWAHHNPVINGAVLHANLGQKES